MSSIARRQLSTLTGLLGAGVVLSGLLALGCWRGSSSPLMIGGWCLLGASLAGAVGAALGLARTLRRAFASVTGVLSACVQQETPVGGVEEGSADENLVGEEVAGLISAINERMGTLGRQRDEQKLAARLAQKRVRHLESVVRHQPDAIVVTDAMDRVVLMNGAASRLLHYESSTEATRPLQECISDRGLCDLLRGAGSLPASKEVEYCLGEGEGRRVLSVSIVPLAESGQDGCDGAVVVMHDVTREQTASKMKTEFVANASHELRTPLGGIKAYLEMLTDGEVKDEQTRDRFYNVMQGEVERLSVLVDNILNIARIEAGIVKVFKEQVPMTAIVQEVVEAIQPQAAATGISLTCELLPVYFHVLADKEMMRRAVFNLVSNALKYTPKGGSVNVRMRVNEATGHATVDVSDTGVGIGEGDLPRLFQKFFRVESSKKMAKGTGLGLVLVKEVVENLHGGKVAVTSEVGKGSTFSITVPLMADRPQMAATSAQG